MVAEGIAECIAEFIAEGTPPDEGIAERVAECIIEPMAVRIRKRCTSFGTARSSRGRPC